MDHKKVESASQGPVEEQGSEKLFYSLGEVSTMTGVEPYVLRYWESEFKSLHPSKRSSGQRSYQKRDIDTILTIKKLLYEDLYTIAGAKKHLREIKGQEHVLTPVLSAQAPSGVVPSDDISVKFLEDIRKEMEHLQEEIRNL